MTEQRINIFVQDTPPNGAAPQPAEQTVRIVYASVLERFVALLIDWGIMFFLGLWLLGLLAEHMKLSLSGFLWAFAGLNVVFILYVALFSCGGRATLGKHLVGLLVVNKEEEGFISFPRALLRAAGYYLSALLCMGGFILAFFDDRHRALQDFLGGSIVVESRPKTTLEKWVIKLVSLLLLLGFFLGGYVQIFGQGSVAQLAAERRAQEQVEKIAFLEEVHYARYGHYTADLLRLSLLSGDPVQFQRDTQKLLEPKGFRIGVSEVGYKIIGHANNTKKTVVGFTSVPRK